VKSIFSILCLGLISLYTIADNTKPIKYPIQHTIAPKDVEFYCDPVKNKAALDEIESHKSSIKSLAASQTKEKMDYEKKLAKASDKLNCELRKVNFNDQKDK
jgi:hypothetical protein